MFTHSERLIGHFFQRIRIASTILRVLLPMRFVGTAARLRRTVIVFLKDLDLFASLCMLGSLSGGAGVGSTDSFSRKLGR